MKILETQRFFLREFELEDAVNLYQLNLDEEVVRFTGDKAFESVESAQIFLSRYDHYRKYGFGRWAVIAKTDLTFCGWCGLKFDELYEEHDIGYRFFKQFWNRGYATETAMACLDAGFSRFGIPRIVGRAMKQNGGSIRVLEKAGMSYCRDFVFNGQEGVVYEKSQQ